MVKTKIEDLQTLTHDINHQYQTSNSTFIIEALWLLF